MRPLLLGALVLLLASLAAAQATEFPVNATCTLESEKKCARLPVIVSYTP